MTEPTERQVLYAIVAAAWFAVVAVLAIVAGYVGVSPTGWSVTFGIGWVAAASVAIRQWRRTGRLLMLSLAVFVVWTAGTLLTR